MHSYDEYNGQPVIPRAQAFRGNPENSRFNPPLGPTSNYDSRTRQYGENSEFNSNFQQGLTYGNGLNQYGYGGMNLGGPYYGNADKKKRTGKVTKEKVFQVALAEVLGTAVLMYLGCLGGPLLSSITFGVTIVVAMQAFGHISGAHLNPSITIAAAIIEEIELVMVPVYLAAEFVGAMLGYTLLQMLHNRNFAKTYLPICITTINSVHLYQGFFIEMLGTGILVLLVCSYWDQKNSNKSAGAITVGLGLTAIFLGIGGYTSASLNSFRSFAPAVYNNVWKDHWVYWVAPNIGAAIAALFYKKALLNRPWQNEDSS